MSMMWTGIGTAVAGVGASIYGANKQAQAIKDANAQNAKAQEEANRLNYEMWLRSRGTGPNGQAVNYILPEWASVTSSVPRQLLRKGQTPQGSYRLGVAGANNTATGGGGGGASTPASIGYGGANPLLGTVSSGPDYSQEFWRSLANAGQEVTFGGPNGAPPDIRRFAKT